MQNRFLYRRSLFLVVLLCFLGPALPAQNTVGTLAGDGIAGFTNGDTSIARFNRPNGIGIDTSGNLYICDGDNHVIRKIATDGTVSTFAGTGQSGYIDGPASFARFNNPYNLVVAPNGDVYVSDFLNQRIRKITQGGVVSTVAGTGVAGLMDGPDSIAQFNFPRGITMDDAGNLYIGDSWNHRIRKIDPSGNVSTFAGGGTSIGVQSPGDYVDGSDTTARFWTPTEVCIDSAGNLYVADAFNHRIRKVDPSQNVTTVAGSGVSGSTGGGFQNGPGNQALFATPTAVYASRDGNLYVGDGSNQRIRKIDASGMVSTYAGSGATGMSDGVDSLATFNYPRGIVIDYSINRMYVVDLFNNAIRYVQFGPFVNREGPLAKKMLVAPNPIKNMVSITLPGLIGTGNLMITDLNGKSVDQRSVSLAERIDLDLSTLKQGVYFIRLQIEGRSEITRKVVKITP